MINKALMPHDVPHHHILIIDDDDEIRELLSLYLDQHYFLISTACDAKQAQEVLTLFAVDIIILDIMMPDKTGSQFLQELRHYYTTPVIMLSALGGQTDIRIQHLSYGADDFIPKPFEPEELLWRIRAILQRTQSFNDHEHIVTFGPFTFNSTKEQLCLNDTLIHLTEKERIIMDHFAKNFNQHVTRETLCNICDLPQHTRSIDVYITRLRQKLLQYYDHSPIIAVRHKGYKLTHI